MSAVIGNFSHFTLSIFLNEWKLYSMCSRLIQNQELRVQNPSSVSITLPENLFRVLSWGSFYHFISIFNCLFVILVFVSINNGARKTAEEGRSS